MKTLKCDSQKGVYVQDEFGTGYVKIHGFHGNHLYDFREWGYAYKFNHI